MTGFDYAVIGIMLISLLLGLWRGLVYEVLSLIGWPLAFMLSRLFSANVAPLLPFEQEQVRVALAYAVVFIVALIVWALIVWMISKLVKAVGMGALDSILGGVFGILRGALIILIMVWVAGMTGIPEQPFWRDAKLGATAENIALQTKMWLPDNIAQRIHYRNRSTY